MCTSMDLKCIDCLQSLRSRTKLRISFVRMTLGIINEFDELQVMFWSMETNLRMRLLYLGSSEQVNKNRTVFGLPIAHSYG